MKLRVQKNAPRKQTVVQGWSWKKKRKEKKRKEKERVEFGSSKFHCDREVVSVYRANRGEIPKTEIKFPSARQPDLLKRLRQCNEWRGVKFDSIERRQKGGEGFLLPNVARSENQPSNVSYVYIYIYIYIYVRAQPSASPQFLDDRDTSPPHDSFTRTIARFLRTKKKKLPSTCPKLLRQQLSCDAWRGVKGHHRPSLLVTAIVRTEPTMHLLETILVQTRYSTSIYIFEQLCAQFYIRFIFDSGEKGRTRDLVSSLSLSVFEKGSPPLLPLARFKRMFVRS